MSDRAQRAAGVLLGQACGDALGVPYEFATPPGPGELAEMKGGGLGPFDPGEWSDDTSMAVAVARGLVGGRLDLDEVARGFLRWYAEDPRDVGIQTRAVLSATTAPTAAAMAIAAADYAATHPHSAGNGALMRSSPVALAFLDDPSGCADAARAVAALTHADPLAGDSCVLWSEAIRVAVVEERLDIEPGLPLLPPDRRDRWATWLREASAGPPSRFTPNGFTVTALQAAWSAIRSVPETSEQLVEALHAAVRIGDDTDTVAAIAGGLLGARWGAAAVPDAWRVAVHGWPGLRADDVVALADSIVGSP